jgi:hypothetical protein
MKSMPQPLPKKLIERAKSGHPESLNAVLNYFMDGIGVTARSLIHHSLAELILEGNSSTPDQHKSEKYIQSLFSYLQIPLIHKVDIFSKSHNSQGLAWVSSLTLDAGEFSTDSENSDSEYLNQSKKSPTSCYSPHLTNTLTADKLQVPEPTPFQDLPKGLQSSIRRSGLRTGETRSCQEVKQIYGMIPENIRRGGPDAVRKYKQQHDWSHKKAYTHGGSASPSNGDWEHYRANRSRGSRQMTQDELNNVAKAKASINFKEGSKIVSSHAAKAGVVAFGVEMAFSGLDSFLAVKRGEKTAEQALAETLTNSTGAAIVSAAFVGGVSALTITFPLVSVAMGAATPMLQLVGVGAAMTRLAEILSNSGKVRGIERLESLLLAYGVDDVELKFRDLEVEDDLQNLKLITESTI